MSSAPGSAGSGLREQPTTVAPARSSSWAMPTPTPRLVPVTTATLPSSTPTAHLLRDGPGCRADRKNINRSMILCKKRAGPPRGQGEAMALRVIQFSTGNVGRHALRQLIERPDLELVGVHASGADKIGRDAADLCGLGEPTGVLATDDLDALVALGADCVVYMSQAETRPQEAPSMS